MGLDSTSPAAGLLFLRSSRLWMNSPMIASGSPMNTSANAPPTIVANICIPDFTFLALRAGGLSSKKIVCGCSFSQGGNSTN